MLHTVQECTANNEKATSIPAIDLSEYVIGHHSPLKHQKKTA